MPKINFYLLKQTDEQARRMLACRLAEKLYRQNRLVHVHMTTSEAAKEFDQLLWTFSADSFIPHAMCTDEDGKSAPVVIGWAPHPAAGGNLLNLTDSVPPEHEGLETIAEFVVNDEQAKAQSRQLWNIYKQLGYELQLHQL